MPRCASCGQDNPDVARFCLACGSPFAEQEQREERKVVTVLFADLIGFTNRSDGRDPEDVRALLEGYHRRAKLELERHGGTVEKFIGDAVMALFGAPVAHEDDPERAVRAALALTAAIAELNAEDSQPDLRIRVGITTGEALISLGARPGEGEGMAAGDVVNTAARLQSAAPENGILVDESTRRATEQTIELRAHDAVQAKGKSEPVEAWEVVRARGSFGVDVDQDARTPLVGRMRELDVLVQALERARGERAPQLVTLIGVPGIGKSRLIWELFQAVDDDDELITWRQGRCLPYGEGIAFWALGEMVKAQAGMLESDTATGAEEKLSASVDTLVPEAERGWVLGHVRPLVGLPGEAGTDPTEAYAARRLYLESLADWRPLVLVFEDLHWADDGLLDFIDHLADWTLGVPLLILCSARPELLERRPAWGGGKLNASAIALSPLAAEDSARLLAALLDQPLLPAPLQKVLLDRAEGNPLYAEQYIRMLADRGLLHRGERGWELATEADLPLPETLQGIIAARLDGLTGAEKDLLQDAAVFGKVFWLGAVADRQDAEGLLHLLERKGFVRRERRSSVADEIEYAFGHALVRDVAYGQIPRLARAGKHRHAAEWIEQVASGRSDDQSQLAAHHWVQALELTRAAGRDDPELVDRARVALVEEGDRSYRLGASAGAAALYSRALQLTQTDGPERANLLYLYGRAAARSGIDTTRELNEAVEWLIEAGDVERAAEALMSISWLRWQGGMANEVEAPSERARELVDERPPAPIHAHIYGQAAIRAMLRGRLDEALELAGRQSELADELGLGAHRAEALITIGTTQALQGREDGAARIEQGLELARELNAVPTLLRAYKNLQSLLVDNGQLARAASVTRDGAAVATRYGDDHHVGWFGVESACPGS